MPSITPLLGTLHLRSLVFFFPTCGYKSKFDVVRQEYSGYGYLTWCKWKTSTLFFFDGTFQSQNKTKLNAQNNRSLGMCQVGDILVVVHSNFAFKFSMTTLLFIGSFGW